MATGKVTVIGAGLCGSLLAIRLAQRGYQVEIFEQRADFRTVTTYAGRSINLALSDRGWEGLKKVGLDAVIAPLCIPMHGRMIHAEQGGQHYAAYSGRQGEYINSVSRQQLNIEMIKKAAGMPGVGVHFQTRCVEVDLQQGRAVFEHLVSGERLEASGDVVIGTDGAGSVLRKSMVAQSAELGFNFSQEFLSHGYKELTIPPDASGGFRIDKHALHIWPRGGFMLIALPNLDGSFTVTLFLPFEGSKSFQALDTPEKITAFFREEFPDVIPHMPDLLEDFANNPASMLGTVKCFPWQAFGKTLLMGDAAHAIVPFYGQGMNASFEDVVVLDQMLDQYGDNWEAVFTHFQEHRKPDADAIADLALDNFEEMKAHTANPLFNLKHKLELQMEQQIPEFSSKYSMVTFREDLRYSEAISRGRKQDAVLMQLCAGVTDPGAVDILQFFRDFKERMLK
jgi:kynurenine 3-monooxygenase